MPKRRANGEGNIRKRKDGRWEGRYTVGRDSETGKAIIKNVLGKTQAEVKEKLKKAIEENVGIDYGRAKTYTVGNWLEVWYENYAKIKMRPSTYLTYHGYIENHIKPQLGKIPLNDLTMLHLQQFYKKLLGRRAGRANRIAETTQGTECQNSTQHPPNHFFCTKAGSRAAVDPPQSGRRLRVAEGGAQGNADTSH